MTVKIHPSAVIADGAQLGEGVEVGPFCVIGEHVSIADGTLLKSHVVITGHTTVGKNNRFFPFASIGHEPQDLKYHGEPSEVIIGDDNTIRENVTINPGTEGGGMLTKVGNNNLLMAYTHIAHDCSVGNGVVLANCATLAGHVDIDDGAVIGGMSAIHQFLRIGRYAMVGGMSGIVKDVPPFCLTAGGYRPSLSGLNALGLKRQGATSSQLKHLKEVYRVLFQSTGSLQQRIIEAKAMANGDAYADHLIEFAATAKKGLTIPARDKN
ncbi:MAG: acyl-ACP--UDP-N-acetylglucosamine O-acyltransferase [Zetaproteobacteria bacterium]|nr:acyl-ACP--UDP-N-acetylglucosamine O-acyltransferase [Zetaproteobacteria bacterium]